MSYRQEISRAHKALFIFLLDQSFSMDEPIANGSNRLADQLALAMNAWLVDMVIACAVGEGCHELFDISVLGYRTDEFGNPIIEPALIGPLAGRDLVSIGEVANNPSRLDNVTALMQDPETGEMIEMPQEVPVWVDPISQGCAPLCQAIVEATRIVDEWISRSPDSFPPIVLNVSSGTFSDGNPWLYADALKRRKTQDGQLLFMNMGLSQRACEPVIFPCRTIHMPDASAGMLFSCSSNIPKNLLPWLRESHFDVKETSKFMALNADLFPGIIRMLDIGDRAFPR